MIFVDGKSLETIDLGLLRRDVGVVLQNSRLASGSVYENICGTARLSIDQAWEIARLAGLDRDLEAMPMGMQTLAAGGVNTLSGGQRQRLLIARALAHRPRLLLMDEATSALDNRSQAIVSESISRLNLTRIVIAHRLSTVRSADRIVVLGGGRIGADRQLCRVDGAAGPVCGFRGTSTDLKHDPEKCAAVFRMDHAQTRS